MQQDPFFAAAWRHTLGIEGGHSNHKLDSGGDTRFGITEATARADGYTGPMSELPIERAQSIAYRNFWKLLHCDDVARISQPVAAEFFDTAFNTRQGFAATSLQRCLNALNRGGRDYPDVAVDGLIGLRTVDALKRFLDRRGKAGERVLLKLLNSLQGAFYIGLSEARPKDEEFLFGWADKRVEMPCSAAP